MMQTMVMYVLMIVAGITVPGFLKAEEYLVDVSKSAVKWTGKKVAGEHYGRITLQKGTITLKEGILSGGTFAMDMNSIIVEDLQNPDMNARLTNHLKSDDFFGTATHPVSDLSITRVRKMDDGSLEVTGNLTIKGITHPVSFTLTQEVSGRQFRAKGKMEINRTQYGIRYGSGSFFSGLGDRMIADTFTLDFSVVANQ